MGIKFEYTKILQIEDKKKKKTRDSKKVKNYILSKFLKYHCWWTN